MAEDGKIIYQVEVSSDKAVSEAKQGGERAGEAFSSGGKKHGGIFQEVMIGAARKVGEAFVQMTAKAVSGVKDIAKAGIDFNAKMEKYATGFETFLGSAEEAQAVMAQIRQDAASTPFDVDSLTQATQMLVSTGMAASDARNDVMNLANAVAATGGGSAELSRMAANLQQIQNLGKASAMDIKQFGMAGINIYSLLADYTGKPIEKLKEMEISYEDLSGALAMAAQEGGQFYGAMEAQSQTFLGQVSTLKDNATQLAGVLTEDLFGVLSENALPQVMEWVTTLLDAAQTGGIEGAVAAAKEILTGLVDSFIEGLPEMVNTGMELLVGFIEGIANNMDTVTATAVTILTTILNGILDHAPELIVAGLTLILNLIAGLIQSIPQIISTVAELIQALWDTFFTVDWSSVGSAIVQGIWNGITGLWDSMVSWVKSKVSEMWGAVKSELGIASPSKKFKYIGEMSVEGMIEGFKDEETDLDRTVTTLYTGMLDTANLGAQMVSRNGMEQAASGAFQLPATGTDGGINSLAQMVSDGFQSVSGRSSGVHTAILNVNGREFCRAIFEDQQIVTNDHGMSLIVT